MNTLNTSIVDLPRLIHSPFARLRELLAGLEPARSPIDMTIGEPRHGVPSLVGSALQNETERFGKYPPVQGTPELVNAIGAWLERRYPGLSGVISPTRHILPLSGSREGLFSAIFSAIARKGAEQRPAVLMPNPFYQAYLAAAIAAGAEPIFLTAEAETGFLPDIEALPSALLERTAAFYLASPANPQGAIADHTYLAKAIALAQQYNFMLFLDECYCEIYRDTPPTGGLEVSHAANGSFTNVVVFNSLSKRSNVPGLRSGFIAGDEQFLSEYLRFRNVACPQMPLPVQHVSALLWGEESHVEASRVLYRQKFDCARAVLGKFEGYTDPAGAFFLWLNMTHLGGSETATKTFWKECGVKVLPGAYLAQVDTQGRNPGEAYVRIALVDDLQRTQEALERLARLLS